MDNIILIGFMGSGKTSVGIRLAKRLDFDFCDTDQIIEKEYGKSISSIFAEKGEEYFRRLETKTIEEMRGKLHRCVLSVGGGLPMREGNGEKLKQLGHVVFLRSGKETILERLKGDTTRPLLAGEDPGGRVEELLKVRTPIYEEASHIAVDTDDRSFEDIIEEIREKTGMEI